MKRILLTLAAATAVLAAPLAASAAPWQTINQRQATLDRRIDQGIRDHSLTRQEAITLRSDFRALNRLETQYRRSGGGLSMRERADLDARFDRLSHRIAQQRSDDDRRNHRRY